MWAGKFNVEAGRRLIAIEYDSDDTAAALRARCARWTTEDASDIAPAFGVRVAKVGFRRRKVGVVHHGAPVRYRLGSPELAVEAIATILAEIDDVRPSGSVRVEARAFIRDGQVVLVDVPSSVDVDERPLCSLGIVEIPSWRPTLDPATAEVTIGDRSTPLAGIVVAGRGLRTLDDARRHVWTLGEGERLTWANFVDELGDRVSWVDDDIPIALDAALR